MKPRKLLSERLALDQGTGLATLFSLHLSALTFLPVASCHFGSARARAGFRPVDFAIRF